jgi:hypothetical protein
MDFLLKIAVYAFIIAVQVGGLVSVIASVFSAEENYYGWTSLNYFCNNINRNN